MEFFLIEKIRLTVTGLAHGHVKCRDIRTGIESSEDAPIHLWLKSNIVLQVIHFHQRIGFDRSITTKINHRLPKHRRRIIITIGFQLPNIEDAWREVIVDGTGREHS